ncbi:MAG: MMPL family transporter [Planctomycetota bacterium]
MNLTSRLADFVFRFRWPVLTLGVLVTLVLGVLSMKLETDTRIAYSLPRQGRETLAYYDRLYQGTIPMILHIEWQPDVGVGRDEVIGVLQQVHQLLGQSDVMSEPLSLLSVLELFPIAEKEGPVAAFGELRFWPEEARDLRDLAIDFEDRSMYVYVRCQDAGTATIADDLSMFAAGFEEISEQYPAFSFRILNSTIMSAPVANKLVADLMRSLLFAIPITLVIVAFALRSAYYGFAGLLPNVFPMVALAAALVMFQQPLLLVGAVVFTISFGIAVDDTIHVLANFKKSYAESGDAAQAIHEVYHKVGGALISSTLILLAGMGVVMLSRTTMVRTFGAMFCITLAFALVADLVLLPAVLACFPPKRPMAPSLEEMPEG